jgi:pimeloyl-ACP methyl ester carboxylesterase
VSLFESPGEGCPPPLSCREVWAALERDTVPWELDRRGYALRGWTLGAGPPLYFANGFAGASALFCLTAWLLRDQVRCVLFDVELRGRNGPSSLDAFCTDLLEAASFHGDQTFSVFGTTFGGTVALQTALVAPERIERLILQSVPARGSLTWAERLLARICKRSRAPLARFPGRLRVQTFNHRRWFPPLDPDRWQCFLEMAGTQPVALAARQAMALAAVDLRSQLGQLRQPVLLIDTEGAGVRLSALQQEVCDGLPNVQEERLHTTGLYPYLTHPHRLVKLIQAWWDIVKPPASGASRFAIPQEETT